MRSRLHDFLAFRYLLADSSALGDANGCSFRSRLVPVSLGVRPLCDIAAIVLDVFILKPLDAIRHLVAEIRKRFVAGVKHWVAGFEAVKGLITIR